MKRWKNVPFEHRAYLVLGTGTVAGAFGLARYAVITDQSDAGLAFGLSLAAIALLGGLVAATVGGVGTLRTMFARR